MQQHNLVEMRVQITAQGPLLLAGGLPIGNMRMSEAYVAGSVWRGSIARAILERLGQRTHSGRPIASPTLPAEFTTVFNGATPARFGFLYPVIIKDTADSARVATPIPLTARTCKRESGFDGRGHGVYDGLLNQLRIAVDDRRHVAGLQHCPHPQCQERLERIRGFASNELGSTTYRQEKLGTKSLVRVGMNRYTETAQDQMLYVQDVLEPGHDQKTKRPHQLTFVGAWRGTRQQAELFRQLLDEHLLPANEGGYQLRIGSARARGLGAVHVQITEPAPVDWDEQQAALAKRLDGFQPSNTTDLYASLTLRTPVQLIDELGTPTAQLRDRLLRDYVPNAPAGLTFVPNCSVLEQTAASGWSAAWGLPKPVGPALAASSVVVLRAPQHERQALLDFLTTIACYALGERRAEGWGEVSVCDSFHQIFDEANHTNVQP